jgi:hypothetical protein
MGVGTVREGRRGRCWGCGLDAGGWWQAPGGRDRGDGTGRVRPCPLAAADVRGVAVEGAAA